MKRTIVAWALLLLPSVTVVPASAQPAGGVPGQKPVVTAGGQAPVAFVAIAGNRPQAPAAAAVAGAAGALQQEPFDVEAATDAYLARLSPEQKARSDAYFEGGYWLQLWGLVYGLAVAWLLLSRRISARMRDFAARLSHRKPLQTALYALQFVVVTTLLELPFTVYTGYFREHQYGLATQTFGPWFGERMIALGVSLVIVPLVLMVLYGVFRRAPRTWWIWGTAVSLGFAALLMLVAPVYIAPLFNTYEPVRDPEVRDPILSMARANEVPADTVYQFDASRQSTRISANVSGLGSTMRISLNDNLLHRTSNAEIQAVMGHELGHYVLNHVYEAIPFLALLLLGGFGFVRWGFDRAVARWGGGWGVHGIGDVAGLPLLVALLSVYLFVLTPVNNTFSRMNEAEADAFGLNAARQPEAFAEVALKLSEYRKLDPGWLEEIVFYDHPSGRARIHRAMQWRAEHPLPPREQAPPEPPDPQALDQQAPDRPAPDPQAPDRQAPRSQPPEAR